MKLILKRSLTILSILCILFLSLSIVNASENLNDIDDMNYIENEDATLGCEVEDESLLENEEIITETVEINDREDSNIQRSSSSSTFEDIQSKIDNAEENDVIELDGLYLGNGNLIKVNKTVTLKGKSSTTLDARLLSPILNVSSANVVLENIIFTNSYDISVDIFNSDVRIDNCLFNHSINGELGSALRCKANNLIVTNSNFTNNIANKSSCHHTEGSAIYIFGNGSKVSNCYFFNNTAYNYETLSSGGAIKWWGDDGSLINCTFLNNSATAKYDWDFHGETITYLADGEGGCIFWQGSRGNIINCSFINGLSHTNGAAIYFFFSTNSSIINSTFVNNYAVGEGGAIYLSQEIYNFTIKNSKFINSTSTGFGLISHRHYPYGSAIYSERAVHDTLIDSCIFSNNNEYPIYNLGYDLVINNSIFENILPGSPNAQDDTNYSQNIVYSKMEAVLENNFWGKNYYSTEDLINDNIIFNNGSNVPSKWINLEIDGLDFLDEKGTYEYGLNFVCNEGTALENSLPDYNVKLKNDISENAVSGDVSIIDNSGKFTYDFVKSGNDVLSICNGLNDLIVSKNIKGGVIVVDNIGDVCKNIQDAIDKANPGDVIQLGDYVFSDISNINITKDINIIGSPNTVVSGNGQNPIFNIIPKSQNGPESVNISDITFKLTNRDIVVKAIAENSTNPLAIDVSSINIQNNKFDTISDDIVTESIIILELDSNRAILAPTGIIEITNNELSAGMVPFVFRIIGLIDGSDVNIYDMNISYERNLSVIEYQNMTTTAVDVDTDGRVGKYFTITLKDKEDKALVGKPVQIGFNGNVYDRVTDDKGQARLQINLKAAGTYTFAVSYLGDDDYNGSFIVAKIVVNQQKGSLTVPSKSYKASATTKSLTATFKSASGKVVNGKKITFTVNGKTYSATTNAKGVATVKVSLNKKGTYSFTAKFAGNNMYAEISKTAKLTIN